MEGHQVPLRGKSNSLEQMMWSIVEKEECTSLSYLSVDLKGLRTEVQMWGEEVPGTQRGRASLFVVEQDMDPPKAPKSALKSPKIYYLATWR